MRIRARRNFRELAKDGLEHQGLVPGAEYYVLGADDEYYRVVDNDGEPILYPKELFEVLDCTIPADWQFCEYKEGEYHLEPVRIGAPGFYEDWHGSDGDRAAQATAQQLLRDELSRTIAKSDSADKRLIQEALSRLRLSGPRSG